MSETNDLEHGTIHERAIDIALRYGNIQGDHHRKWVIDQMVRILAGGKYDELIRSYGYNGNDDDSNEWDIGIAP